MAVIDILPNGMILLTLTPREAVMFSGEILDPGDYPWQGSESQLVAVEVKMALKDAVERIHQGEMNLMKQIVEQKMRQPRFRCNYDGCEYYGEPIQPDGNGNCTNCGNPAIPS